ncbi:MAG: trigger factor [Candidatus Aminicenantes bacterium]|nr:MAG: trigger factor [Candidatus Aminicenantes bacterium]
MTENMKNLSECKKELHLEIPASEVMKEWDRVVDQYASRAKIKGFRPGKAPKDMIKRMYSPDIRETLINNLVPQALNKELTDKKITPVGQPVISDLHLKENEPIRFNVTVEVWPEIHLPEYTGIKVAKKKVSVTEKEIKDSLEELRAKSAEYIPAEKRGVKDGDYVVAEIKGKNTQTKRFLPTEKVVILAGHQDNEEALNKNLIGLSSGEIVHFTIQYKKNHENKKLAGQEIAYELKVDSIKEKKLPDINDDFAKDLGNYKNLKDLKTKLKEQLRASKEGVQRREMAEEIIGKITEKMSMALPESVIEQESNALLNRQLSSLPQQNLSKEAIESLREDVRKRAVRNIQNHLILTTIAEKEKLKVSEEEIKEEMKSIAKMHNVPVARVIESIDQEGQKEELKDNLLIRKTVDFLVKSAIIE